MVARRMPIEHREHSNLVTRSTEIFQKRAGAESKNNAAYMPTNDPDKTAAAADSTTVRYRARAHTHTPPNEQRASDQAEKAQKETTR